MIEKEDITSKRNEETFVDNSLEWVEKRMLLLIMVFIILSVWYPWANIALTVSILTSYVISFRMLWSKGILKGMIVFWGVSTYTLAIVYALLKLFFPETSCLTVLGAFVPVAFVLFSMKRNGSSINGVMAGLAVLNAGAGLVNVFLSFTWLLPLRAGLMFVLLAYYVWTISISHVYARLQTVLNSRSKVHSLAGDKERMLLNLGIIKIVNHTNRSAKGALKNETVSDEDESGEDKKEVFRL